MNIGEINGVQVAVSPEAYEEVKKQKIIEENNILKEQQQELERYKNIIDELEKFINNQNYWFCELGKDLTPFMQVKLIQDKLKKLKGE